jgi:electron transfer flavoprotein beta subunit
MKVLVPVKRVVDPYAKVKPLADASGIDTTSVKFEINPFDEIALEEAVRLKESGSIAEIIAVSIGPAEAEEQLRKALAMGADRAILIETSDPLDSTVVAAELHAVATLEQPDLIIMGKQATDDDNNQAGQMLAARLGWPQATFACKVGLASGVATVVRETDSGTETLEIPLPCLITTDLRLNEPRYIALPGIIKARTKPLERRTRSTSASPKTRTVRVAAPPARAAGKKVGSVTELLAELRSRGVAI